MSEIHDAWSNAIWIPEALHALASDRADRRTRARQHIDELMFHQGTPCEGTGAMIVLLVNLAAIKDMPDRALIMRLVGEMLYVEDNRSETSPLRLSDTPLLWHSDLLGRRNVELTWGETARVADLLQTLALTESNEIAWWAARILLEATSRRRQFPLPAVEPWPQLSSDVVQRLSGIITQSNANELPKEHHEPPDTDAEEELQPGDSFLNVILHGAVETVPEIRNVTTLSGERLSAFLSSLEWRTLAWADGKFVTGLLHLIRTKARDGAGEPLHDELTVLLAHTTIHCDEAVELLLSMALGHERMTYRHTAAGALAGIDWSAEERVDALIHILNEGDFVSRLGVLGSDLGCSTGSEWLKPWTEASDPERLHDHPRLRNRLLPSIMQRVDDTDAAIRAAAIRVLSVAAPDEPESVAHVVHRQSDPSSRVRRAVGDFAGSSRWQERTFPILEALRTDDDPEVRSEAIRQLAFPRVTEGAPVASRRYAVAALDDPDPRVVAQAAWVVCSQLDNPQRLPEKQELACRLAASVSTRSPAMNVIFKGALISCLDASLAVEGDKLMDSAVSNKPDWMCD